MWHGQPCRWLPVGELKERTGSQQQGCQWHTPGACAISVNRTCRQPALFQIALVVFFGPIELRGGHDFRHDGRLNLPLFCSLSLYASAAACCSGL